MKFTHEELLRAAERKLARFPPKFNAEGDGQKKRAERDGKGEGNQAPKRRKLIKDPAFHATASNTANTAKQGRNQVPPSPPRQVPNTLVHQTSETQSSQSQATPSATAKSTNNQTPATPPYQGDKQPTPSPRQEDRLSTPPPHQENRPPTPPPHQENRPPTPPPHQENRPPTPPPHKENRPPTPPSPNTPPNLAQQETEVFSKGTKETSEECITSLLHAGCIFAKTFQKLIAVAATSEELKAENDQLCGSVKDWQARFDQFVTAASKEKVRTDKMMGAAGRKIGELETDLSNMRAEADDLDAKLKDRKEEKERVKRELTAKDEVLAAKDSELNSIRAELEAIKKALGEETEKATEAQAAVLAATEEKKKISETHQAALAEKETELGALRSKLEEMEKELSEEKAKAGEAREKAADIAYENREEGFYIAKDQAQFLFPNLDFSPMGVMKEITKDGLVGPDDPPRIDPNLWADDNEEEEQEEEMNNDDNQEV
ncbi:uncharacterized protein LOC130725827 [Lotus japonicus]|uniref:uncharacterized protein LOC130725827 n=1 Tax=Lotus japonicus TaxID=34305 RepID=UPI00258962D3|nr:uncharacterized protein LOC130725827 [Lotus japonicus]